MSDLVAFLRARLDEDEAYAREPQGWNEYDPGDPGDPARVLREVEAKRKILADLPGYSKQRREFRDGMYLPENADYHSGHADGTDDSARYVARCLAAVYRDHPDYDEAWEF
jgi:Family of unknown function (DUF6221)